MRIRILCVGKLKEKALCALCDEYKKRLERFVKIEIVEVADEPAPESLSLALQEKVKKAEGKRRFAWKESSPIPYSWPSTYKPWRTVAWGVFNFTLGGR